MKINRLYTKIFLSFLGILIITEALIFVLFVFFAARQYRERFERYVGGQAAFLKELVEDKIQSDPLIPVSRNQALENLIQRMGTNYGAGMWLTGPDGTPLVQSFEGVAPVDVEKEFPGGPEEERGPFTLYKEFGKGHRFYVQIPIQLGDGQTGVLHALFRPMEPGPHKGSFALGLLVIGVIIALLVAPISRQITRPLNRLRRSAARISEGDLSHRASLSGRDEIGQLGQTFNQMAERLERMIRGGKELTANVSHELRSPLTRIRVAEEIIRNELKGADSKRVKRHLDSISEDIEEMDRLIGRILEFSRLDIHDGSFEHVELDLTSMLDELLSRFDAAMRNKELTLRKDLPLHASLFGDRESLRSAFTNLLDNAVKFAPERGVICLRVSEDANSLRLSVTNTYRNLSEEELDRLFEPFYRVDDVRETGTGLGLAITRKIIERNGGRIRALNSEDGLRFEVQFQR